MLSQSTVRQLVGDQLLPALQKEQNRLNYIDRWHRWHHDKPHSPRSSTREYRELAHRAISPWLALVVSSSAQALYVDGYRRGDDPDNVTAWDMWQANGMDRRQGAIHRGALTYGLSYETVLPGFDMFGTPMAVMRGVSPRRMIAFYEDPAGDDWATYALQAEPAKVNGTKGWTLKVFDDTDVYYLNSSGSFDITYFESRPHDAGVCPVIRFAHRLDLEGRSEGEVEPYIPIAGRIDQTTFDRLVVQRFASWVVRTIAGMAKPDDLNDAEAEKLRLKVEDILIAEDADTKFGSLPASPLDGFNSSHEVDVKTLAAVSQTPTHALTGDLINLNAEALAAADATFQRKIEEIRYSFGESHEQSLRLTAHYMGDAAGARDMSAEVRWRDMESRSLAQAADALGKIATMLQVPVQVLWEKIPGWTSQDVELAKEQFAENEKSTMAGLIAQLGQQGAPNAPVLDGAHG